MTDIIMSKKGSSRLDAVLAEMYRAGHRIVTAGTVAERLWPDGRRHNTRGQVFPLGAAVAARLLRRSKMAVEVEWRRWEILAPNDDKLLACATMHPSQRPRSKP